MRRCRRLLALTLFLVLCGGGIWLLLRSTAQYPSLVETVSYPVNQVDGFQLSIEEPTWSPFRGYTLRYDMEIASKEVYFLMGESKEFEYLEMLADGQWHRLNCQEEPTGFITFPLGGSDNSGFSGSLVQKYDGYGTRLEPGTYRLTLELTDRLGEPHYLAAEFSVR